jgi:hypothetical protein
MQTDWAAENLQTIRTLMERTALYRRALAPVMILVGFTGLVAGVAGTFLNLRPALALVGYWVIVAVVCLAGAALMIRRQALKDAERFWSPPTRRVAQAVTPAFFAGLAAIFPFFLLRLEKIHEALLLVAGWIVLYGLAMHAAGFFMPRGFKLFGWGFVLGGVLLFCWDVAAMNQGFLVSNQTVNGIMGGFFGGAHLAYGLYLRWTEKPGPVA